MASDPGSNWSEKEVRELSTIRAEEEINAQLDGTVWDADVYSTTVKLMCIPE